VCYQSLMLACMLSCTLCSSGGPVIMMVNGNISDWVNENLLGHTHSALHVTVGIVHACRLHDMADKTGKPGTRE